jgi:hypothetical protein
MKYFGFSTARRLLEPAQRMSTPSSMSQSSRFLPRLVVSALVLGATALAPATASAGLPEFGPRDVPTTFYISKSDDKNRVDYGIHMDERCAAPNDDSIFLYWREFEHAPPVKLIALSTLDYIPYGIGEQRAVRKMRDGGIYFLKLKQFDKTPIYIITKKGADGKCTAQARSLIGGKEAELSYIYVKLKGPMSVDYLDVHGKDLETGAEITERLRK